MAGLLKKQTKRSGRSIAPEVLFKTTATALNQDLRCSGEGPLKTPLGEIAFREVSGNASEIRMRIKAAYAVWNHCVARQLHR